MKYTVKQQINNLHRLPPHLLEKDDGSIYIISDGFHYGLIDDNNVIILSCEYDNITVIGFGLFQLVKNGKLGILHLCKEYKESLIKTHIPCEYDAIECPWHEEIVVLRKDEPDGMKVRVYFTDVMRITKWYCNYKILDRDTIELYNSNGSYLYDARNGKVFLHHTNQSFMSLGSYFYDNSNADVIILTFGETNAIVYYDGIIAKQYIYDGEIHPIYKGTDVHCGNRPLIKGFIIKNVTGISLLTADCKQINTGNATSLTIDHHIEICNNIYNCFSLTPFSPDIYQ